jgi:hypothetical protein
MRRLPYLAALLILLLAGGYWLSQSDGGILWRMGLNPAKLTASRVQGKDGYMMDYPLRCVGRQRHSNEAVRGSGEVMSANEITSADGGWRALLTFVAQGSAAAEFLR